MTQRTYDLAVHGVTTVFYVVQPTPTGQPRRPPVPEPPRRRVVTHRASACAAVLASPTGGRRFPSTLHEERSPDSPRLPRGRQVHARCCRFAGGWRGSTRRPHPPTRPCRGR